jgi:hypothetical protein
MGGESYVSRQGKDLKGHYFGKYSIKKQHILYILPNFGNACMIPMNASEIQSI